MYNNETASRDVFFPLAGPHKNQLNFTLTYPPAGCPRLNKNGSRHIAAVTPTNLFDLFFELFFFLIQLFHIFKFLISIFAIF
jgi:hypothetical protein